ncbi:hypothetical protein [Actinomadura fibrosa]|uniref:Uncharacterized protein n=1 Tax=Actinomadura fibrosa TaxID=111802 RepID=A0ABW2XT47_9ACTN|nr:hypothetical protein [Actinomadura fibrosa]
MPPSPPTPPGTVARRTVLGLAASSVPAALLGSTVLGAAPADAAATGRGPDPVRRVHGRPPSSAGSG